MKTIRWCLLCLPIFLTPQKGQCQETVFSLLTKDASRAETYFADKNYPQALELYLSALKKYPGRHDLRKKAATCYFLLKDYQNAAREFGKVAGTRGMTQEDLRLYAEALTGAGNYDEAINAYRRYLEKSPDDAIAMRKLWRIQNAHFLFEDSVHYAIRRIPLNSDFGELCPTPYRNGLVYLSNRKEIELVEKRDGSSNTPFYRLYFATTVKDSITGAAEYGNTIAFTRDLNKKYHIGPVAFFDDDRQMVFSATSELPGSKGIYTLQLGFARHYEGRWEVVSMFPYNSFEFSNTDPAISADGKVLYFSSDRPGGYGGKDIYRSNFHDGQWTEPQNLGENINTQYDESFPYLHQGKTLYFSSNGQPGLGGLDIFRSDLTGDGFGEPQNAGFPMNSSYDDFGVIFDSLSTHGYFTSNRVRGGFDDDVYEFDIDLQTYPLVITGVLKYKQNSWSDSTQLHTFANATMHLIDNLRGITVHEAKSDSLGRFSLTIPHFSKYKIRVTGIDSEEYVVSLELAKHRKADGRHEIVVVKDPFKTMENYGVK